MFIKYFLNLDETQMDDLDHEMYEFGIDDEIWWEDQNRTIVTENPTVIRDLELLLHEFEISYTKVED